MASRGILLAGLLLAGCGQEPPNIVFILADDLGYGEVGAYGSALLATPSLDRMAAEGTRFTQVYAAGPICGPTRCGVMTGLHRSLHGSRQPREDTGKPCRSCRPAARGGPDGRRA
ncbi:MAG: sulfatase-like hydrolase/transferase [Thermoanaerobaculia bacterium]